MYRTTQKNLEQCGPCPVFAGYTLAFALQLRKKQEKNLSQDSRRVPATKLHGVKSQSTVILTAVRIRINVKRKKIKRIFVRTRYNIEEIEAKQLY
jgi:hypothetical protein